MCLGSLWLVAGCVRDSRDLNAARGERLARPSGVRAQSWPVCSLIGPRTATPGIYGTDLGFTARGEHDDKLAILFGDTWTRPASGCEYPTVPSDDLQAFLPRARPAALRPGPPPARQPVRCELLEVPRSAPDDPTTWPHIRLFPNPIARSDDAVMDMTALRTPLTAFSDGERMFGVFFRGDPVYCRASSECPQGMRCSSELEPRLGACAGALELAPDAAPAYCRSSHDCGSPSLCGKAPRDVCLATKPFDLETAQGTVVPTWYRDDPRRGMARVLHIAAAIWPDKPADYATLARFSTNRFQNMTARTVAFFDPERPEKNDYRPGYHTLLIWGRAAFVEIEGAQALPFFAYLPLSELRGAPEHVRWNPRFFAGLGRDGKPRWSEHESDARPIYGDDAKLVAAEGGVKLDWREPELDYVSQTSVAWVAPLSRWIMLYGGDVPAFMVMNESGRARDPVHLPFAPGAIHLRAAEHPWGRAAANSGGWSSPQPVLTRNAVAAYLACGDEGPEGLPGCQPEIEPDDAIDLTSALAGKPALAGKCLGGEVVHAVQDQLSGNPIGRLYGVNVIEEWTQDLGEGEAEIYWNASTWNPYQVVLIKTRLKR